MEVGEETAESLSCIKEISDGELEALAHAAVAVLLGTQREDTALVGPVFEQLEVDLIKRLYSSLVCVFVEAVKNDASSKALMSFLRTECGIPETKGEVLADVFVSKKEELRNLLSRTSIYSGLPRLTGVDWRLDYCVSSSEERAARELLYHVNLKTLEKDATGKDGRTNFVCSVEQLQDLVSRLKDACKSVERAIERR